MIKEITRRLPLYRQVLPLVKWPFSVAVLLLPLFRLWASVSSGGWIMKGYWNLSVRMDLPAVSYV